MGGSMNAMIDKSEIENAIQEINGAIMDFTDTVNSLIGVKNLLNKFLDINAKKENNHSGDATSGENNTYFGTLIIKNVAISIEKEDIEYLKKLLYTNIACKFSMTAGDGITKTGLGQIVDLKFNYKTNTAIISVKELTNVGSNSRS
jgi:hypothetical protein